MTDKSDKKNSTVASATITGRPTLKSQALLDNICELIGDGISLREICTKDDMPSKATVFRWLSEDEDFQDQYAHARELQADTLVDEIIDIADDSANDYMDRNLPNGSKVRVLDKEAIRRSALRIDARKWAAAKMRPKKYGDKQQHEHSGALKVTISPEDAKL